MRRWSRLGRAALVVAVLGVLLVLGGFGYGLALRPSTTAVGGSDMAPTYRPGQRVVTAAVDPGQVRRGDVVVFRYATESGPAVGHFKRVIALGGDHVSQCGDQPVQLNGAPLDEPYLRSGTVNGFRCFDVTVPEGRMFVMGDHRANSLDSRVWGAVPLDTVKARDVPGTAARLGIVVALGLLGLLLLALAAILGAVARRRGRTAPAAYPAWVVPAP
ncbi:signal peptidase I [Kitasatospora cheerisanensis]|uniref:Signal peptidase I n=1 Tax=Kitasatospora cheerisanensis KCTC 2395 TaxID=1348663 RepID=A0A066YLJ6_9ACTN|nr:signal peptidase I [Kitasatospora cheerisanensis]KDN82037.1 putative peptidase S26A family protein [Kitasatospora cheerisanensis KCTC 2395]